MGLGMMLSALAVFFRDVMHLWDRCYHGLDVSDADFLDNRLH